MAGSRHIIAGNATEVARELPLEAGLLEADPQNNQNSHDHSGHRDRLRDRFNAAPNVLPDYELLELLLAGCLPRVDTKPLAKALINHFGDLGEVMHANVDTLADFPRTGKAKLSRASATHLKAVAEAGLRLSKLKILNRPIITAWDQLIDYCNAAMGREGIEQFRLLYLDHKNTLIADEVQQKGTIDHTPVYPREVLKRALELNCSAVIMVHNHPSGDPTPSKADIDMTRNVQSALRAAGISLHDHLIIGRRGHTSFKSSGLI